MMDVRQKHSRMIKRFAIDSDVSEKTLLRDRGMFRNEERIMHKKTVLTVFTILLTALLLGFGSAEAGMVEVVNNSRFVLAVGVQFMDGSKNNPVIVNPNSTRPAMGCPVKAVTKIRVINTTDGADPNKATLKDYLEMSPNLSHNYVVTVDQHGNVTVVRGNSGG
jgi:hypothetical protein